MTTLLAVLACLAPQESELDRIRTMVATHMTHYSEAERAAAVETIWKSFDKLTLADQRTRALKHIEFTISYSSKMFPKEDAYQDIHRRNPHLEALEVPAGIYRADYGIGIRRVELSLALVAAAERRSPADIDALKDQVRDLTDHARTACLAQSPSEQALAAMEHGLSRMSESLVKCADAVHMGYHRPLAPGEMASIKAALTESLSSINDAEFEGFRKEDLDPTHPDRYFSKEVKEARKAAYRAEELLKPLLDIEHLQRPGIRELEAERIANTKKASAAWSEIFARVGAAYHEILTREHPPKRMELPVSTKDESKMEDSPKPKETPPAKFDPAPVPAPKSLPVEDPSSPPRFWVIGVAAAVVILAAWGLRAGLRR